MLPDRPLQTMPRHSLARGGSQGEHDYKERGMAGCMDMCCDVPLAIETAEDVTDQRGGGFRGGVQVFKETGP